MISEEKINAQWATRGVVSSRILQGDLYKTRNALYKLAVLSELEKFYISKEDISVEIKKEKPEEMVSKTLWLMGVSSLVRVTAIKKGAKFSNKRMMVLTFDDVNETASLYQRYKPLDSCQRS